MWEKEASNWDKCYIDGGSSRAVHEGDAGIYYRFPKFVEMFQKYVDIHDGMRVLEIGGGVGEMCDLLMKEALIHSKYTITEYSEHAVDFLEEKYKSDKRINVLRENVEHLSFEDNSFDVVTAYDVMHHVNNPQAMADEMLRVSKGVVFMCDACGTSIIRKMGEMSKLAKELGEKSYTPARFRKFFHNASEIKFQPFYFFVPPKTKKAFLPFFKFISEIGQRIPLLRWQSQSLVVYAKK